MNWIFKNKDIEKIEEFEMNKAREILHKNDCLLTDLLHFSTLSSRFASEAEKDYLKAHPDHRGDGIHESESYRRYRIRNSTESMQFALDKLNEPKSSNEDRESLYYNKKNQ